MTSKAKQKAKRPQSLAVRPQMAPARRSNSNLSSLKSTTMLSTKTALPAEIMAMVLDLLPVPDLMRIARTSKRMQEMVYDDTRWVALLQQMGMWNEAEARQNTEAAMKRKIQGHMKNHGGGLKNGAGHANVNGVEGVTARRKSAAAGDLMESGFEEQVVSRPNAAAPALLVSPAPLTSDPFSPSAANSQSSSDLASKVHGLEDIHSFRGHARQTYAAIYEKYATYLYTACNGEPTSVSLILEQFPDPIDQAAMINNVREFSRSDVGINSQERTANIDTWAAEADRRWSGKFEDAHYRDPVDLDAMRLYASALARLNGGKTAVQSYILNNRLVQRKNLLGDPLDCLHHAFPGQANLNPSRDFFDHVTVAISSELRVISYVFPTNAGVDAIFLENVGSSVVAPYVTALFDTAYQTHSKETYLKLVAGLFAQFHQMLDTLTLPASSAAAEPFTKTTKSVLLNVFEPHLAQYFSEELSYFKSHAMGVIEKWDTQLLEQEASAESFFMSNVSRQAAKRDFLTSFKKFLMAPVNVLPSSSASKSAVAAPDTPSKQSPRPGTPQFIGNEDSDGVPGRSASPLPQARVAPTTELEAKAAIMNSQLAGMNALCGVEVAVSTIQLARSSLERVSLFAMLPQPTDALARTQCDAIFLSLIDILGYRHMKVGFDKAAQHLDAYTARGATAPKDEDEVQPLVTFLELVHICDLMTSMIDALYKQELEAKKLTRSDDFLNPATKGKKKFEELIDGYVGSGLEHGIKALEKEVDDLLSVQPPTDYNPGGEISTAKAAKGKKAAKGAIDIKVENASQLTAIEVGPTGTGQRIVELLKAYSDMLRGVAEKPILDTFNLHACEHTFRAVEKHLKRSRVSQEGATRLISDTKLYYDYVTELKMREVIPMFAALRGLCQIYLVDGSQAKEIASIIADRDRFRGVFREEDAVEFASRRADWLSIQSTVEKQLYGAGCLVM